MTNSCPQKPSQWGGILLGAHLIEVIGSCESQEVRANFIDTLEKKWTKKRLFSFVSMLL